MSFEWITEARNIATRSINAQAHEFMLDERLKWEKAFFPWTKKNVLHQARKVRAERKREIRKALHEIDAIAIFSINGR